MKCCKKKIIIICITSLVVLVTFIGLTAVLLPKGRNKVGKTSELESKPSTAPDDKALTCTGAECSDYKYPLAEEAKVRKSCSTEDCVLAAARMLKWIDRTVDPCVDFYNFSCGNFIRSYTLPEGWDSYGSVDVRNEEVDLQIKNILEEPIHVNDSESLNSTKKVFSSCMNLTHIEESSVQALRHVLTSAGGIGEWPLLKPEWKDCRLDVEWRLAKLNAMGVDSLFRLETDFQGEEHRLQAIMSVAQPLVDGICNDENVNESIALDIASKHRSILQSVLEFLDVEITNVTEDDMDDVFKFDLLFCNATRACRDETGKEKGQNKEPLTLLKLADIAPQINWIRWRNIVFSELRLNFPHDKQRIYVDGIERCIEGINHLISETPSKVVANYLTWKFVFHHLGFLSKPFRQIVENHPLLFRQGSVSMVSDRWIPRWRQCVIFVKDFMPMGILKKYHDLYHEDDIDRAMDDIVTRVKNEFRMIMKDTRDLLENDRIKSYHKIDKVQVEIAYPSKEDKFYAKFYSNMGCMSDSFLENGMKVMSIRMRKLMEGVSTHKTISDMEYAIQRRFPPFYLNAYSFFRGNSIIVTLTHLLHLITPTFPKFKTMSTFGVTIGHELTHGFDLEALNNGLGSNWTWWPTYVLKQVQKKALCYRQHFPYPEINNEAKNKAPTLNEDLCDHQGMHLAFKAYLKYLSKHGGEEILPGLSLSNEKLFFISYAQQLCEIRHTDDGISSVSPGRRRVNVILKNFPAFSDAFKCANGKPMKSPKCRALWV